jgi:hypothetical protein
MNIRTCQHCNFPLPPEGAISFCTNCGADIENKQAELQFTLDNLRAKFETYVASHGLDNEQAERIRQQIEQLQERLQNE